MQNLMILWRAWFLSPVEDTPELGSHRSRQPAREHRAAILAILALKSCEKETKC